MENPYYNAKGANKKEQWIISHRSYNKAIMSSPNQISLGDFLAREHGLKRQLISTTTTTYISEIDGNYDIDEWCLIAPDQQTNQHQINQLSQRVNDLEATTKRLLARIDQLEENQSSNVSAAILPPQKALPAPLPKAILSGIKSKSLNLKQIEYKKSGSNVAELLGNGDALQRALVLQKQKILAKGKKRRATKGNNMMNKKKSKIIQRNKFQQELACRVQNPQLRQSWHILKARKVQDPHAEAVMKFCRDLMTAKSQLKQIPAPDCKTIIVLD